MKLATFFPPKSQEPVGGEIRSGKAISFRDGNSVLDRLTVNDFRPADGPDWPLADVQLLAPVPTPRAIFGIGLNYAGHAAEQGKSAPEEPIVFMKLPSSSTQPSGPVQCPNVVQRLDYEGELAVIIGSDGKAAGYAVADDVSARDLQKREPQWTRAKGADTFCPWGPWLTTTDEVVNPENLWLKTWVNGELRQDASTDDLIFGIEKVISFISETCTLKPGDLILTGTPSGVGMAMQPRQFLQPGDRVRVEIEHLGWIEHQINGSKAHSL